MWRARQAAANLQQNLEGCPQAPSRANSACKCDLDQVKTRDRRPGGRVGFRAALTRPLFAAGDNDLAVHARPKAHAFAVPPAASGH